MYFKYDCNYEAAGNKPYEPLNTTIKNKSSAVSSMVLPDTYMLPKMHAYAKAHVHKHTHNLPHTYMPTAVLFWQGDGASGID